MKTRRTFLKLLFGAFAVILPWTVFPDKIVEKMNNIIGEPQAILEFPPPSEVKSGIEIKALSRKAIEDIEVLTSENFEGRRACTAGDIKTENYLVEKLIEIGLKGFGKSGFVQIFSIPPMEERIINGRALFRAAKTGLSMPSSNVLGGIEGENKSEIIIISAHFDHLGIYKGNLCPGANDNASGVGCVLEVLRRLVKDELEDEKLKCTVVGVFWGAEEMGYLGSKHFVKDPVIPLENIKAVINLDTVANGNKGDFIMWTNDNSQLLDVVKKAVKSNDGMIELTEGDGHHSDEVSFFPSGIPAITILSRDWLKKNHTSEDDLSLINKEKLDVACNILYEIVKKTAY